MNNSITEDAKSLSPILQSLFDWVDERSHLTIRKKMLVPGYSTVCP